LRKWNEYQVSIALIYLLISKNICDRYLISLTCDAFVFKIDFADHRLDSSTWLMKKDARHVSASYSQATIAEIKEWTI